MSFDGPVGRDFENVAALNSAYLAMLGTEPVLQRGLSACPESLRKKLTRLSQAECRRLAETPLLLFSFRERDDRYWDAVLDKSPETGLFRSSGSEPVDTLVAAALGFIWQLANRNPYALRLICGATLYWCERIAERTCFGLLDAVRNAGDIPVLRYSHLEALWRKLLDDGISADHGVRKAAQLAALQSVLTDPAPGPISTAWPLAARHVEPAGLRVAEIRDRTKP
jgi:hypothetical protein